jgi:tetratricopeptide (TPR) repeat protein
MADKALELNSDQHLAHKAKALIYFWFDWDFEKAEKSFIKAMESAPPGADAIHFQQFLINVGRFEESLELGMNSFQTDPLHFGIYLETGLSLFFLKRYDESEKMLKRGIELNPEVMDLYNKLGKVYLNSGKYEEAIEILEEGLEKGSYRPPSMLVYHAIARSKSGNLEAIPTIISELEERRSQGEKGIGYFLAHLYSAMDDPDTALDWLETAVEEHEVELIWLMVEPQFEALREYPRFKDIEETVGFPGIN